MINELSRILNGHLSYRRLLDALVRADPGAPVTFGGVAGSLRAIMLYCTQEHIQRQLLLVTTDKDQAVQCRDDIIQLGGTAAVLGSGRQPTIISGTDHSGDVETLRALTDHPAGIVVVPVASLLRKLPSPQYFSQQILELRRGEETDFATASQLLNTLGFEKKDFVETRGDFSVRGGILDVFPFVGEHPVRVEFLGDCIESIREFDVLSQRSIKELEIAAIIPDVLHNEQMQDRTASVLDYVASDAIVILQDPDLIRKAVEENIQGEEVRGNAWAVIEERLKGFIQAHEVPFHSSQEQVIDFRCAPQPAINGNMRFLRKTLTGLQQQDYAVFLTCDTQSELQRLKELIVSPDAEQEATPDIGRITFSLTSLHAGFAIHEMKVAVFTEHQIFNRLKRRVGKRATRLRGFSEKELHRLRKGDFVVHADYGIGRFDGLKKIVVQKIEQEVLTLSYEGGDALYVNLSFLNKIHKYSSKEGHVPRLTRLGRPDWEKLKERTKKRIKDIARDLIRLYAERKRTPGFSFARDTPWQSELEASFMYEDTFDQAKATREVKTDMEAPSPMDRLICGDVGFGKTEVAIRAAFKAVMNGKQVGVLVPTTILAVQHFNTFSDRTSPYSTNIQVLTRFKTKPEQTRIIDLLKTGAVDIVIGTHRLLSKDVSFKDLGLLIIDEEHRFGVSAKEKLRKLKASVDTLTLTATPIPRTLHFSLMGARDLSIISTPPRNRLPVITELTPYKDDIIRDAIIKEVERGGQVYVVHDRVSNISEMCAHIRQLVPSARVRHAHGQMEGHELEEVMVDFQEKKFDVLVCTKIIESGLDIPNVNTIIIIRADRFGMAELYQLRGRVGRSNIQAYAYLLTPPLSVVPKSTLLRLQAVEEFTELGSGFHLAMRDLEIRGAGNLLGAEQSGFIETMGFETYTRILEEAVAELKEHEFQDLFKDQQRSDPSTRTEVDVEMSALIPKSYVDNDTERLDVYRKLYNIQSLPQLDEAIEELRDRFGPLPVESCALLDVIRVKLIAGKLGFVRVKIRAEQAELQFPAASDKNYYESPRFQDIMTRIAAMKSKGVSVKNVGTNLTLQANLKVGYKSQSPAGRSLELLTHLSEPPPKSVGNPH